MIIWDNLKVTNGTSTVTISAANGISGKLNGITGSIGMFTNPVTGYFGGTLSNASGTINASGTFSGNLNYVSGVIGRVDNPVSGWFDGTLVGALGSVNNITCNGLTTINAVNFNQSVNLPSGSTINGSSFELAPSLKPGIFVQGYSNDDIVLVPVAFSDTTSQTVTVKVQAVTSNNTQYNMTVTFSGTASNLQVTHTGDFPWYDGSFTGYDYHISDVRNQSSYSITIENGDATNNVDRAQYLASNLSANNLLGVVQTTGSKFMIDTIAASPRTDSFAISNFYGLIGYVLSNSSTVNSISYYYREDKDKILSRTGSFGIISGSSLENVIHPGPLGCIFIE